MPKRGGGLKPAGKRCRKAPLSCNAAFSMLQCSFSLVAAQLLVILMTSTVQKSQCCSATSAAQHSKNCSATSVFACGMLQGWGLEGWGLGLADCWETDYFIHLQCWEVQPFFTIQRQQCIKFRVLRAQDFYTPLALNCQKGQHLPALEVFQNQSPTCLSWKTLVERVLSTAPHLLPKTQTQPLTVH